MPNRARQYLDRLLGRNEGSESRDFTTGRQYGERQRYFEDEYGVNSRDIWDEDFYSERERNLSHRFAPLDSFAPGDFRNTLRTGRFHRVRPEDRGHFGKGPKGWKWSDERIKDQVSEALYRDYRVDASEIEVDVKDGVVTLSGSVESRQVKREAEECIENLSGVIDVHNRIRIMENRNVPPVRHGAESKEKRSLS